ncbi:polysaccharide pyruvyl transferase family protein [Marinobacterium rhizophilum]|uniref:polysaccharide pyruvyl transferase family protein n=1 Tax=Marinobacterium rhizophilum TaxID=420402 RepID=UPI00037E0264|nr:polysaccharide pyruvyl transferase family protein [Marinobacterium rhizophilum]
MKKVKCYIRGAYGPGNIGDDILMVSTYKSMRKVFDSKDIYIGVEDPVLGKYILPEANFIHIKKPFSADVVILGGGGQFFSFLPPVSKPKSVLSKVVTIIKRQSGLLDTLTRLLMKARGAYDNLYFAQHVAAYCIGLGPFESEGKNLDRTKKILPSLSYISVRESTSAALYKNFVPNRSANIFTDPSFNRKLWISKSEQLALENKNVIDEDGFVSFIVRDWPHSERGQACLTAMFDAATTLRNQGQKVRFICLYKDRDEHLVARAPEFEWVFWEVDGTSPSTFFYNLCQSSKVIVSARAHGVMLAAAFNTPTIAIEIEPKLKEIHKMLPTGTRLVSEPSADSILSEISEFPSRRTVLEQNLKKEYETLEVLSQRSEKDLLDWIRSNR